MKTRSRQESNQERAEQAITLELGNSSPTRLATNHLSILSLEPQLVLDPFLSSGSVGIELVGRDGGVFEEWR